MPERERVQARAMKRARSMGVRSGNFWKKAPTKPWPGKVFSIDYQRGRAQEYYRKSEDLWKGARMTSVQAKGVLPAPGGGGSKCKAFVINGISVIRQQ